MSQGIFYHSRFSLISPFMFSKGKDGFHIFNFKLNSSIHFRIDNMRQRVICAILVHSLAMLCRLSYYISEKRQFFFSF